MYPMHTRTHTHTHTHIHTYTHTQTHTHTHTIFFSVQGTIKVCVEFGRTSKPSYFKNTGPFLTVLLLFRYCKYRPSATAICAGRPYRWPPHPKKMKVSSQQRNRLCRHRTGTIPQLVISSALIHGLGGCALSSRLLHPSQITPLLS